RCRHCPIPPVYGGRFVVVSPDVVLADVRQQIRAGARHVTFGDPDFLNGPRHALPLAQALHAAFPGVTFAFTPHVQPPLRAPPPPASPPPRPPPPGLPLRRLRGRVPERRGPRPPRQGPHQGRRPRARRSHAGDGDRAPSDLGRLHAVDGPRRLPGDARFRG